MGPAMVPDRPGTTPGGGPAPRLTIDSNPDVPPVVGAWHWKQA